MEQLYFRHVIRRHQQVVGKCGGDRLRVFVKAHPFEQGVADAVRNAAENLSVNDHRVEPAAAVVHDQETQHDDPAGIDIHFHLGHGRTVGIHHVVNDHGLRGFQPRPHTGHGQFEARQAGRGAGQFRKRQPPVRRVLDEYSPAVDLQVMFRRLQEAACEVERPGLYGPRGGMGRGAGDDGLAAVEAAESQGRGVRIPAGDADP